MKPLEDNQLDQIPFTYINKLQTILNRVNNGMKTV